jgi:hypothetical protein
MHAERTSQCKAFGRCLCCCFVRELVSFPTLVNHRVLYIPFVEYLRNLNRGFDCRFLTWDWPSVLTIFDGNVYIILTNIKGVVISNYASGLAVGTYPPSHRCTIRIFFFSQKFYLPDVIMLLENVTSRNTFDKDYASIRIYNNKSAHIPI